MPRRFWGRLQQRVREVVDALAKDMEERKPDVSEAVVFVTTCWWAWVLTFRSADMDQWSQWSEYGPLSRVSVSAYWSAILQVMVLVPLLAWLFRSQRVRRWWLLMETAWWLFVSVFMMVPHWTNPMGVFPIVMSFLAYLAYLNVGAADLPPRVTIR
jgi:hypothetical protein